MGRLLRGAHLKAACVSASASETLCWLSLFFGSSAGNASPTTSNKNKRSRGRLQRSTARPSSVSETLVVMVFRGTDPQPFPLLVMDRLLRLFCSIGKCNPHVCRLSEATVSKRKTELLLQVSLAAQTARSLLFNAFQNNKCFV